jgi:hypothetical protein
MIEWLGDTSRIDGRDVRRIFTLSLFQTYPKKAKMEPLPPPLCEKPLSEKTTQYKRAPLLE